LERGLKLAGTSWSGAISDLVGAWLRAHTSGQFVCKGSSISQGLSKGAILQVGQGKGRAHFLGAFFKELACIA
jgi:hypothetical protein